MEFVANHLSPEQRIGLYNACHCLVFPYRAEAWGMQIAEAMAAALPVIVPASGPALDLCQDAYAYLIPTRAASGKDKRIWSFETVDFPTWAEPQQDFLRILLRHVAENQEEAKAKGTKAREFIQTRRTWDHTVATIENRLAHLCRQTVPSAPEASSRKKAGPTVSLTLIVRNEEKNLPACLDSVADLVDEIIVVDTGSNDKTVELARRHGMKVFHFPWIDDFSAARNEALNHASGDWIFWMDADDRLDEPNRQKLASLFEGLSSDMVGYVMKCVCLPDPTSGTATIVDHVRLFPNHPDVRWQYRIHEQILLSIRRQSGSVRWSDVAIQHIGYQVPGVRQKKLERDLRLLNMENQEHPDDPFTLFNLGNIYVEQKLPEKAIEVLERSLRKSKPTDSIVRKLYSGLTQCYRTLNRHSEAKKICQEGRGYYPEDPELLFQESVLLQKLGDRESAIACLLRLVATKDSTYFASVDSGLRGCKGHHNLAVLYHETNRLDQAEKHWGLVLADEATFLPSLVGLGDLYLKQGRRQDLQTIINALEKHPQGEKELRLLQARKLLEERQFELARRSVGTILDMDRDFLPAWITLSHVLLREGIHLNEAERVLREILKREPGHDEAGRNLSVLVHSQKIKPAQLQNPHTAVGLNASHYQKPPLATEMASIIILCCNQLEFTRMCLASVLERSRPPFECVIVDNGSSDATWDYLQELQEREGPERIRLIRNESNRGFPTGCNQGLTQARGQYVVFLNNDTIVTTEWLQRLIARSLVQWPMVGLVGPTTNNSRPPQEIPVDYPSIEGIESFAEHRRQKYDGRSQSVTRLSGFCLFGARTFFTRSGVLTKASASASSTTMICPSEPWKPDINSSLPMTCLFITLEIVRLPVWGSITYSNCSLISNFFGTNGEKNTQRAIIFLLLPLNRGNPNENTQYRPNTRNQVPLRLAILSSESGPAPVFPWP